MLIVYAKPSLAGGLSFFFADELKWHSGCALNGIQWQAQSTTA